MDVRRPQHLSLVRVALSFAALAVPVNAFATLGGNPSSVEADRISMQGSLVNIVRSDSYTVHEMRSASGTNIREYVALSGTVFAVAWDGPWLPDLQQLLGVYFKQYEGARIGARRARGVVQIHEPNLVVQIGGHQRSFSGRAYVPQLAPTGLRLETVR